MGCIISGSRIAFIGSGLIADDHAYAARAAGFNLAGVSSRPGSPSVAAFANKHSFEQTFHNPHDLVSSTDWDALVVCTPVHSTLGYAKAALGTSRPVLLEKPVARSSYDLADFQRYNSDNLIVGFNRRQYSTAAAAKAFFAQSRSVLVSVEVPERIDLSATDTSARFKAVLENAVHVFDLLRYIIAPSELVNWQSQDDRQSSSGSLLLAESSRGDKVVIKGAWNSPSNFLICLEADERKLVLSPLEMGRLYQGLEVTEPSTRNPVREYHPLLLQEFPLESGYPGIKPGFFEQMKDLLMFTESGKRPSRLASIEDARHALIIAERLVGLFQGKY